MYAYMHTDTHTHTHPQKRTPSEYSLCCLYTLRYVGLARPLEHITTTWGHTLKENWLPFSWSLSITNGSSERSGASWPPPLYAGFGLAWAQTCPAHPVITTVSSWVQLSCCVHKHYFLSRDRHLSSLSLTVFLSLLPQWPQALGGESVSSMAHLGQGTCSLWLDQLWDSVNHHLMRIGRCTEL